MPSSPDEAPLTDEERRDGERAVLRLVAALLAVLLAGAVAVLASREADEDPAVAEDGQEVVNAIGPLTGVDLPTYRARRAQSLARLEGTRAAVVSFGRYVGGGDVAGLVAPARPVALLVAAPGGLPVAVRGDLSRWAETERRRATEERVNLERLLPTVDDDDFARQYRAEIERLLRLEASVAPEGPVVFGAVVVADAAVLKQLAASGAFVDVGPVPEPPDTDRLAGIRPEEQAIAGEPPTRPLP